MRRLVMTILLSFSLLWSAVVAAQTKTNSRPEIPPSILESNRRFALKLFRELVGRTPDKNIVTAPPSLSVGFGLLQNGASPEVRQEIAKAFEFGPMSPAEINQGMLALRQHWTWRIPVYPYLIRRNSKVRYETGGYRLQNTLWAGPDATFRADFVRANGHYYGAELKALPRDRVLATAAINAQAAKNSNGNIRTALESTDMDDFSLLSDTRLRCSWEGKLKEYASLQFKLPSGAPKDVTMVGQLDVFEYLKGSGFQVVRANCQQLNYYVFLPDEDSSLAALVNQFTPENWVAWTGGMKRTFIEFKFPQFCIEYNAALRPVLEDMGMKTAYCDLHAFAPTVTRPEGARLTRVLQTSFVDVNKDRIDGGSVSYSGGVIGGILGGMYKLPQVIADRPFAFAITDDETGAVLFLGTVVQP